MAHRLLSTARKLERLLWNGVKRGNINSTLVIMVTNVYLYRYMYFFFIILRLTENTDFL